MSDFLCELCCPDGEDLGEFIPGYYLINLKSTNTYAVISVETQGHFQFDTPNEATYIWGIKPEIEIEDDESDEWCNQFDQIKPHLNDRYFTPIEGYNLVTSCIIVGFNPNTDGDIQWWLFFKAVEYLKFNNEVPLY